MEELVEIINSWDPIGFFPMAPKDEYSNEIKKIYEYIYSNKNLSLETLAKKINSIFVETFGTDVYCEQMGNCMQVADKILREYNKNI